MTEKALWAVASRCATTYPEVLERLCLMHPDTRPQEDDDLLGLPDDTLRRLFPPSRPATGDPNPVRVR